MTDEPSPGRRRTRDRAEWLRDIALHGDLVERAVAGLSREEFIADELRRSAACYDLLCVSEATARLLDSDPTISERNPELPWRAIRGIGNVLRHGYHGLDYSIIWETAVNNLPRLLSVIKAESNGSSS